MDPTYSFGETIKQRRKALGLTQPELAEGVHCSAVTIKKIEADQRRPSRQLAQLLAQALAVPDDQVDLFIDCARGRRPVDLLAWDHPASPAPGPAPTGPPPLPAALTRLIGRESELAQLRQMLAENWLVTITGLGGAGKTRLALDAAAQEAEAGQPVALVSLADASPEDDLPAVIIERLGLSPAVPS
jgi:transcriptional regulator with XRE-family HTH domain